MVLQGVSVITKQISTWKIQKKHNLLSDQGVWNWNWEGRVKMVIAWNGFAIESLQLQTWGVKYCKWQLEPACSSKQCKTFYTAYTAPDLMLTNGVTPCKEFFHQSDALTGRVKILCVVVEACPESWWENATTFSLGTFFSCYVSHH